VVAQRVATENVSEFYDCAYDVLTEEGVTVDTVGGQDRFTFYGYYYGLESAFVDFYHANIVEVGVFRNIFNAYLKVFLQLSDKLLLGQLVLKLQDFKAQVNKDIAAKYFDFLQNFMVTLEEFSEEEGWQAFFEAPGISLDWQLCGEFLSMVQAVSDVGVWQAFLQDIGIFFEVEKQQAALFAGNWATKGLCFRRPGEYEVKHLVAKALSPGFQDQNIGPKFYDWFIKQGGAAKLRARLDLRQWGVGSSLREMLFEESFYSECLEFCSNPNYPIRMAHGMGTGKGFRVCVDRIAEEVEKRK
jgi:hypothetical protein